MATKSRRQLPTLKESLIENPYSYEFHQAVKIIEAFYIDEASLGEGIDPSKEALSLKSRIFLAAPPSDIYDIKFESNDNGIQPEVHINFMGLAGLQGPLPIPYTELALERLKKGDTSIKDFLDIFNHRMASILHRIRKKYWVGLDNRHAHETPLGQSLLSFTGMHSGLLSSRKVSPQDLLYYSGIYWKKPRSSAGLKQILSHYFDVPVRIESHQGQWVDIDVTQQTHLGFQPQGKNNVLGIDAALGTRYWNVEEGLNIILGPMPRAQFEEFLKIGTSYQKAREIIGYYLPDGYHYTIQLILLGRDVSPVMLDGQSRIGWTSWMVEKPKTRDDDQVILYPS